MTEHAKQEAGNIFRRFQWHFVVLTLAAGGVFLAIALNQKDLHGIPWKLFLTCIGLSVGALLRAVQFGALPGRSKTAILGAVVIALSQICFFLLVWTGWKEHSLLWRLWWITMVPSVFVTLVLLLRSMELGHRSRAERVTLWCVTVAGLMTLLLGFRKDLFGPLPLPFIIVGGIAAMGAVSGSLFAVFRWLLGRVGAERLSKRALAGGLLMSHLLLLVLGFYIGRAVTVNKETHPRDFVRQTPHDVKEKVDRDIYKGQSKVATFLGDTRLVNRPPYISEKQVEILSQKLQPGDILLERRNWYLSNPWLPGFWPHAALYVGTLNDLETLGVSKHPAVMKHLKKYAGPAQDGHLYTVIEAVSDGVILNTLSHSAHADYIVALRPRLTDQQKAAAVIRAFEQLGKPYDFNFDFDDTSKLVCTQLVVVSYEGLLNFKLKNIMGRRTLPANEIARKYVDERERPDRQMDFVLFLDADPRQNRAHFAGEKIFLGSVNRPRALVEQ